MANVPQAGHPIRLPPWRVEVAQPDGTSGYMLPPATNPYDWRGQAVRSPLHLPAAMTPHLFGLMRGQEAPLYSELEEWVVSRPRPTDPGNPVRVPPRTVVIMGMTYQYATALRASIGSQLEEAGIFCFGGSPAIFPGFALDVMNCLPLHAVSGLTTSIDWSFTDLNGSVADSGSESHGWGYPEVDPERWLGREALVISVGQPDRIALQTAEAMMGVQEEFHAFFDGGGNLVFPPGMPEVYRTDGGRYENVYAHYYNFASKVEGFPEVVDAYRQAILRAAGVFDRIGYRSIGMLRGTNVATPFMYPYLVPRSTGGDADTYDYSGVAAAKEALDVDVNALSASNLDAIMAGSDFLAHHFPVGSDSTLGVDDFIDVPATIADWILDFYREALS